MADCDDSWLLWDRRDAVEQSANGILLFFYRLAIFMRWKCCLNTLQFVGCFVVCRDYANTLDVRFFSSMQLSRIFAPQFYNFYNCRSFFYFANVPTDIPVTTFLSWHNNRSVNIPKRISSHYRAARKKYVYCYWLRNLPTFRLILHSFFLSRFLRLKRGLLVKKESMRRMYDFLV